MRHDSPQPSEPDPMPSLFDHGLAPVVVPISPHPASIEAAFREFHRLNPWVYTALVKLARQLAKRGHRKIGIGMLFEVLRWHWFMDTVDAASDFKLNNNYRSRYARLIMEQELDLTRAFEIRALTSD